MGFELRGPMSKVGTTVFSAGLGQISVAPAHQTCGTRAQGDLESKEVLSIWKRPHLFPKKDAKQVRTKIDEVCSKTQAAHGRGVSFLCRRWILATFSVQSEVVFSSNSSVHEAGQQH